MRDVIYRDDAIEAMVCHIWHTPPEARKLFNCENYVRDVVEKALNTLPSAKVVPKHDVEIIIDEITKRTSSAEVVQGEWICRGDYAICSKCGGSSGTQFDGVERTPRTTAFCPHCGRRMKGAEHEID